MSLEECFFDGHEKAFEFFGGIPEVIRYDNLTSAVQKVLSGRERMENERFVAFRSHYGFTSSFCTPGIDGAHEKGGIEGEVKRARRRYFVPLPHGQTLGEINDKLHLKVDNDDKTRHISYRRTTVHTDFTEEKKHLMRLVGEPFGCAKILFPKVDAKSRISVRSCHYSVPVSLIGKSVEVALSASDLVVVHKGKVVARHDRLIHRGDSSLILDHYLEAFTRKPGAFASALPLDQAKKNGTFWAEHASFLAAATQMYGERDGVFEMISVLLIGRKLPKVAVVAGINAALEMNSPKASYVEIKAREYLEPDAPVPLSKCPEVTSEIVDLGQYDQLLGSKLAS